MGDYDYLNEKFSTRRARTKAERTESWHDYLQTRQGSVGLTFRSDDFNSAAHAQQVGHLQIVDFATAGPTDYRRRAKDVRRDGDHSHRLFVPLRGEFRFEQRDDREVVRPGQLVFFGWGDPFLVTHDHTIRALIMTIPEHAVDLGRARNAPLAMDMSRPLVRGLHRQVRDLAQNRDDWTADEFTVAYSSVLRVLGGALNPTRTAPSRNEYEAQADKVLALMKRKANDPAVTPAAIARMSCISLRTLHTVLEETGNRPPARLLTQIRIDQARQLMLDEPSADLDTIAARSGFTSTRRLRETLQRELGLSPNQLREQIFG